LIKPEKLHRIVNVDDDDDKRVVLLEKKESLPTVLYIVVELGLINILEKKLYGKSLLLLEHYT